MGGPQRCVDLEWLDEPPCGASQICEGSGDCVCAQGFSECSSDSCVDTASDPNNCGRCGQSCLGGECSAGSCQPLVLASDQAPESFLTAKLVTDETSVYWINLDDTALTSIRRVAKTGGAVQTIVAPAQGDISSFSVAGNDVLFGRDEDVLETTITIGTPRLLFSNVGGLFAASVSIASGFNYWLLQDHRLFRERTAGGATRQEIPNDTTMQGVISALRVIGDCVYYAAGSPSLGGTGVRRACAGAASNDDLFRTTNGQIQGFDADASGAYVLLSSGSIFRIALQPGPAELPVFESTTFKAGLAVDATSLYFVEPDNDAIWRVSKAGGAAAELFAAPVGVGAQQDSIVTDVGAVYWVDGGNIIKKAK